jgi:dipeptidyl aminopeptidase/acylaminoacyl peptidase
MSRWFIGTMRVRAAAIEDTPAIEVVGPAGRPGVFRVTYRVEGKRVTGLVGLPPGDGPAPGVVVCHPSDDPYWTGRNVDETVEGLARAGFVAFAPDYRGWGGSEGDRGNEVIDVVAAVRALRAHPRVGGGTGPKVGLVGFSFGGGVAARAAAIEPVDTLVLYYAQLGGIYEEMLYQVEIGREGRSAPEISNAVRSLYAECRNAGANDAEILYVFRRTSPLFEAHRIAAPTILFHGAADRVVPPHQSRAMARALREAGRAVELKILDGLDHAFANSSANPTWDDLLTFLRTHLAPS